MFSVTKILAILAVVAPQATPADALKLTALFSCFWTTEDASAPSKAKAILTQQLDDRLNDAVEQQLTSFLQNNPHMVKRETERKKNDAGLNVIDMRFDSITSYEIMTEFNMSCTRGNYEGGPLFLGLKQMIQSKLEEKHSSRNSSWILTNRGKRQTLSLSSTIPQLSTEEIERKLSDFDLYTSEEKGKQASQGATVAVISQTEIDANREAQEEKTSSVVAAWVKSLSARRAGPSIFSGLGSSVASLWTNNTWIGKNLQEYKLYKDSVIYDAKNEHLKDIPAVLAQLILLLPDTYVNLRESGTANDVKKYSEMSETKFLRNARNLRNATDVQSAGVLFKTFIASLKSGGLLSAISFDDIETALLASGDSTKSKTNEGAKNAAYELVVSKLGEDSIAFQSLKSILAKYAKWVADDSIDMTQSLAADKQMQILAENVFDDNALGGEDWIVTETVRLLGENKGKDVGALFTKSKERKTMCETFLVYVLLKMHSELCDLDDTKIFTVEDSIVKKLSAVQVDLSAASISGTASPVPSDTDDTDALLPVLIEQKPSSDEAEWLASAELSSTSDASQDPIELPAFELGDTDRSPSFTHAATSAMM